MEREPSGLPIAVPAVLIGVALVLILLLGLRYRDLARPRRLNAEHVQRVRQHVTRASP
jgi:hypothetical protein